MSPGPEGREGITINSATATCAHLTLDVELKSGRTMRWELPNLRLEEAGSFVRLHTKVTDDDLFNDEPHAQHRFRTRVRLEIESEIRSDNGHAFRATPIDLPETSGGDSAETSQE